MGVDSDDERRRPSERPPRTTLESAEPPAVSTVHRFDSAPPEASDDPLSDDGVDNPPGPTIFVSDPTVEAARIEWALRARGYVVIDVPLAMLVGRAAVQRPHLVLLDVDAPGALDVAARMRSLPGAGGVHLIYAGHAGQTFGNARDALAHEGSGFFARPIDIEALIEKIGALLGVADDAPDEPVGSDPRSTPPSSPSVPPSSRVPTAPPRRSSRPPPPPSLRAPPSPLPPRPLPIPPGGPISLLPPSTQSRAPGEMEPLADEASAASSDKRGWTAKAAETRLSPDLEKLLRDAEARVAGPTSQRLPESGMSSDEDVLSPEDEVEAVLPAEILASLDEPLDIGVDDEEGSSGDTGTPRGGTTGGGVRVRTTGSNTTTAARTATGLATGTGLEPVPSMGRAATSGGHEAPHDGEPVVTTNGGRELTGAKTGAGSAADIAQQPAHENDAQSAFRQASTPRPPRRIPSHELASADDAQLAAQGTNAGDDDDDERGQSQVSQQMAMPRPASEHPPPLAPITARPPPIANAPQVRIPSSPPRPSLEEAEVDARPMPRSTAVGYGLQATPKAPAVASRDIPTALPAAQPITSSDDALRAFARAVATRVTGVLRVDEAAGIRRIVLQDGDVVTAASSVEGESLLGYLQSRGDLAADVVKRLEGRVPPFGRLAGAALVAHGHLHQEQLWDVLQAHAAWLLTRTVAVSRGQLAYELEAPARLKGEPPVFGGTPGPALVVEIARRAVPPAEAVERLGGPEVRLATGERGRLVDECGLEEGDETLVRSAVGASVREVVEARGEEVAPLLYALVALGVISALAAARPAMAAQRPAAASEPSEPIDPLLDAELDDGAIRARVAVRRALVEDGDYFAILGVPRAATGYEIRRAYVELRRALDPSRVLRPALSDLVDDLQLVLQVLDEAYDVLKDATRRERYRRAISHEPPQ